MSNESMAAGEELVCINVGGKEFWTYYNTLERLPNTTLSSLAQQRESHQAYLAYRKCFFFDRSPEAFHSILEYYRTDELHVSEAFCGNAMKKELEFWGLNEAEIEPCCWGNYAKYHSHKETLADLESAFGGEDDYNFLVEAKKVKPSETCWEKFKKKGWLFLEYPSESKLAKVLMFISMGFVILSILETILESHYLFRVVYDGRNYTTAPDPSLYYAPTSTTITTVCDCFNTSNTSTPSNSESTIEPDYPHTEPHPYLSTLDDICLGYFLLELVVRLIFSPSKCKFFKAPLNIIDIVCVIPQLISIVIKHTTIEKVKLLHVSRAMADSGEADFSQYEKAGDFLKAITVLRTVRILRVFKLMKHYSAFKILAYTIKVSTKELLLMVVYLMTGVLIFASIIHYAEDKNFPSIPIGFWWALVTMTTVGYGDKHPKELVGYLVGSICVMSGVLVIAFTVPIVVNNFSLYYTHAKTRIKLPKETVQEMRRSKSKKREGSEMSSNSKVQLVSSIDTVNGTGTGNEVHESSIDITLRPLTPDDNSSSKQDNNSAV